MERNVKIYKKICQNNKINLSLNRTNKKNNEIFYIKMLTIEKSLYRFAMDSIHNEDYA